MKKQKIDLVFTKLDKLFFYAEDVRHIQPKGKEVRQWKARCDCGKLVNRNYIYIAAAKRGRHLASCGACEDNRNISHAHCVGSEMSPTYRSWRSMKYRCKGTTNNYINSVYKDRGISVCIQWENSFETFLADMGERPEGKTLDRIDNDKGYSPDNCRWATKEEQTHNRRVKSNTGVRHISFNKRTNQFNVRVKKVCVGTFKTMLDAYAALLRYKRIVALETEVAALKAK